MKTEKDNRLGENIKKIRELSGLNQTDLGKLFSTGKNTISDYETGRSTPNIHFIKSFCSHFGITSDSLLGLEIERDLTSSPKIRITSLDGDELELVRIYRSIGDDYKKEALKLISVFRTAVETPKIKKAE